MDRCQARYRAQSYNRKSLFARWMTVTLAGVAGGAAQVHQSTTASRHPVFCTSKVSGHGHGHVYGHDHPSSAGWARNFALGC
jgi:hypothetical protein